MDTLKHQDQAVALEGRGGVGAEPMSSGSGVWGTALVAVLIVAATFVGPAARAA